MENRITCPSPCIQTKMFLPARIYPRNSSQAFKFFSQPPQFQKGQLISQLRLLRLFQVARHKLYSASCLMVVSSLYRVECALPSHNRSALEKAKRFHLNLRWKEKKQKGQHILRAKNYMTKPMQFQITNHRITRNIMHKPPASNQKQKTMSMTCHIFYNHNSPTPKLSSTYIQQRMISLQMHSKPVAQQKGHL